MKSLNVEVCIGHNIGVSKSYYKPATKEVLEDYLKAVDLLTVYNEGRLSKQVQKLTEKDVENQYIIKAKLDEKDETIMSMKEKYDSDIALLKEAITDMQQLLRNPKQLQKITRTT
jgi:tetrahydromethanopterin S-methyltransferase subunit A